MKRVLCILLIAVAVTAMLCSCGKKAKQQKRIDTGAVKHIVVVRSENDASKEDDIIKRRVIVSFVDIYNSMSFNKTDDVDADELSADGLYSMTFYDYDEKVIGECSISAQGYVFVDGDMDTPYKLTEAIDLEEIDELIAENKAD